MSIRPIKFNNDGSIEIWHDERKHGGTVQLADVTYAKNNDGSDNINFIVMPCPILGCNSASLHPASGGCDKENIQRLFELKAAQQ